MRVPAIAPPQLLSMPDCIQILLHIAVQHQLRVGIGIVVDQVIQLPAVKPGFHELPFHGEGINGNHRSVWAPRLGNHVTITEPESVVKQMNEMLEKVSKRYK